MCRPTTCEVCGKTTWKGCGKHIDSVKEKVPAEQWCDKDHSDEEYAAAEKKRGFFGSAAIKRHISDIIHFRISARIFNRFGNDFNSGNAFHALRSIQRYCARAAIKVKYCFVLRAGAEGAHLIIKELCCVRIDLIKAFVMNLIAYIPD